MTKRKYQEELALQLLHASTQVQKQSEKLNKIQTQMKKLRKIMA